MNELKNLSESTSSSLFEKHFCLSDTSLCFAIFLSYLFFLSSSRCCYKIAVLVCLSHDLHIQSDIFALYLSEACSRSRKEGIVSYAQLAILHMSEPYIHQCLNILCICFFSQSQNILLFVSMKSVPDMSSYNLRHCFCLTFFSSDKLCFL